MIEFWDKRYSGDAYAYGEKPNKFFREYIEAERPGKILFPADGEGRNGVFAAVLGWDVTSVDFSEQGRRKALLLAKKWKVDIKYVVSNIAEFDTTEKFDSIALIFLHMPPEVRKLVHSKLTGMLKPGGTIVLEAFSKEQLNNYTGGPRKLDMLYNVDELKDDFAGMDFKMLHEYHVYLNEGGFHFGPSDVVRMIAKNK